MEWNTTSRKQATESAKQAVEAEYQTKLEEQVEKKVTEELIQGKGTFMLYIL